MSVFNQSRQNVIRLLFLVAFAILVIRLLFLQLSSSKYDLLALDNAVSKTIVYPDRGIIFDRKGRSILENTLTYDLMVLPNSVKNLDTAGLCRILNINAKAFHDRLVGSIIKNGRFRPSVFEAALNTETFVQLQENIFRFEPGFLLARATNTLVSIQSRSPFAWICWRSRFYYFKKNQLLLPNGGLHGACWFRKILRANPHG